MFRAIGFVILLAAFSHFFAAAFHSFETAIVAVLETVETAANVSTMQLERAAATVDDE